MRRPLRYIGSVAAGMNYLAALAVMAMTLLTMLDVILRFFRCPIPGAYEVVGFLGAIVIAFSLGATSLSRGHIAVDFLIKKLPASAANFIERLNLIICLGLFVLITRYMLAYGEDMRRAGEVSMTLQIPVWPFIYGIAAGCAVLCAVFMAQFVYTFAKTARENDTEAESTN